MTPPPRPLFTIPPLARTLAAKAWFAFDFLSRWIGRVVVTGLLCEWVFQVTHRLEKVPARNPMVVCWLCLMAFVGAGLSFNGAVFAWRAFTWQDLSAGRRTGGYLLAWACLMIGLSVCWNSVSILLRASR